MKKKTVELVIKLKSSNYTLNTSSISNMFYFGEK